MSRGSDGEALTKGQRVAAQVPYTKRKQEWIVASVVSWNRDDKTYVVKDEYPENRKLKSWTIPKHKVIRFPRQEKEGIAVGDRVLSLWYLPETDEWSSMFYEATIVNIDGSEKGKVFLKFNGDDEIYAIDTTKFVKKPKRRAQIKPGSKVGTSKNGSTHIDSDFNRHNGEHDHIYSRRARSPSPSPSSAPPSPSSSNSPPSRFPSASSASPSFQNTKEESQEDYVQGDLSSLTAIAASLLPLDKQTSNSSSSSPSSSVHNPSTNVSLKRKAKTRNQSSSSSNGLHHQDESLSCDRNGSKSSGSGPPNKKQKTIKLERESNNSNGKATRSSGSKYSRAVGSAASGDGGGASSSSMGGSSSSSSSSHHHHTSGGDSLHQHSRSSSASSHHRLPPATMYRYPPFCGVLGKKMKRMQAIISERNKVGSL
ncbi:U-box domain-containing protein [Balamuthia mandrillaris]